MEQLTKIHKKLVKETELSFFRYLYHEIDWGNRIVGIRGPRGVGKTTLMLQHIKNDLNINDVLYINADDIYFSEHRILDLAERLVQRGIQYLFIDEIHRLSRSVEEVLYSAMEDYAIDIIIGKGPSARTVRIDLSLIHI